MQASRFVQLVKAAQAYYPAAPQQQYAPAVPQSSNLLKQADALEKRAEEAAQANLLAQLQDLLVKNPKVVAGLLGGTLGAGAGALVPSTDEATGETHRGRNALLGALLGAGAGVGSSYIPGADNAISTALQGQNPFAATKTANYNPYMLKQADLLDDAKKLIAENPQVALGLLGGAAGGGVGALIPSEHRLRNALIGMGLGGAAGAGAGFIPQVQDYLKDKLLPPPPPPPPPPPAPEPAPLPAPEPEDEGLSTGAKAGIGSGAAALALASALVLGRKGMMRGGAKWIGNPNAVKHFLGRRTRALGKTTDKAVNWIADTVTSAFKKGEKAAK